MTEEGADAVLLVCNCEAVATDIMGRLVDAGINVVGPVSSAAMALAMAAQVAPTIALVASPPDGRRNATELAGELMRSWGIRSWIFDGAAEVAPGEDADWRASPDRVRHIRNVLEGHEPTRASA